MTFTFLALGVNVIVQVVAVRLSRGAHFLRSVVIGFAAGACFLVASELALPSVSGSFWRGFVANPIWYAALSYCYFNFINLGQSSIRIRIYEEIRRHPDGMPAAELDRKYNEALLMHMRLERLMESGDIGLSSGRYFIRRKRLVPIATIIFQMKRIVLGKESEFE